MKNYPDYIFFNTGMSGHIVADIFEYVANNIELQSASVGSVGSDGEGFVDKDIRNCLSGSIPKQHWINGVLDYYVREANTHKFNYDLVGWHDEIEFLHYDGKGTGYKWHSDISSPENDVGIRKLTLLLCLSNKDDYEGGELQLILDGRREMESLKLDMGDCVIFPSTTLHRVRPLKSGERSAIVGWYGGPDFR
jgi:hypothetical protein